MIGFGTLLNAGAIVVGGIVGMLSHGLLRERHQEILNMTCGVCVMFIGIAGAMRYMLSVGAGGALSSGREMFIVLSLVLGALVGETINIEHGFERFGENNRPNGTAPYIEGAWMTKYKGKYYLQYAAPGTEFNVYSDGVYVADAPLGPYRPAVSNPYSFHRWCRRCGRRGAPAPRCTSCSNPHHDGRNHWPDH